MSAMPQRSYEYDYGYQQELEPVIKKRVIKKKKKNKMILGVNVWMIIVALFAFGIFIVYNDTKITAQKMQISTVEDEIATLNNEIDGYNIYLENLNNTNMIENMAKSYLGMNYPTRKQTVFLEIEPVQKIEKENSGFSLKTTLTGIVDMVIGIFSGK